MASFKEIKSQLRTYFSQSPTQEKLSIPDFLKDIPFEKWISPLFACLPEEAFTHKAAHLLGYAVSEIYQTNQEKAKTVVRRFIWQMNEESGNIAWGIPQAFAATLIASPPLAEYYHKILISYIRSKEGDGNYCDYAPLRIHCLRAVESLLEAYPQYLSYASPPLKDALNDPDTTCKKEAQRIFNKFFEKEKI